MNESPEHSERPSVLARRLFSLMGGACFAIAAMCSAASVFYINGGFTGSRFDICPLLSLAAAPTVVAFIIGGFLAPRITHDCSATNSGILVFLLVALTLNSLVYPGFLVPEFPSPDAPRESADTNIVPITILNAEISMEAASRIAFLILLGLYLSLRSKLKNVYLLPWLVAAAVCWFPLVVFVMINGMGLVAIGLLSPLTLPWFIGAGYGILRYEHKVSKIDSE